MARQIVQHYMDKGDHPRLLEAVTTYAKEDEGLWAEALSYFVGLGDVAGAPSELAQLLETIERERLLPPIMVLQIIARPQSGLSLGAVRGYLGRTFEQDLDQVDSDRSRMQNDASDTAVCSTPRAYPAAAG